MPDLCRLHLIGPLGGMNVPDKARPQNSAPPTSWVFVRKSRMRVRKFSSPSPAISRCSWTLGDRESKRSTSIELMPGSAPDSPDSPPVRWNALRAPKSGFPTFGDPAQRKVSCPPGCFARSGRRSHPNTGGGKVACPFVGPANCSNSSRVRGNAWTVAPIWRCRDTFADRVAAIGARPTVDPPRGRELLWTQR